MVQLVAAARSHPGLRRAVNEDSAFAGPALVLVADGVGGSAGGAVASSVATLVAARLAARWRGTDATTVLDGVVRESRAGLRAHVVDVPTDVGLATTLTALHTDGVRCSLVHLGDSRAYLLRRRRLVRLTTDHTWVAAMVADGHLSAADADRSPYRHQLLRWLGADDGDAVPDLGTVDLLAGDRVLLCSDGLTDEVGDDLLATLLAAGTPDDAADALVAAALSHGGHDNVTCVVADVHDGASAATGGRLVGAAQERLAPRRLSA